VAGEGKSAKKAIFQLNESNQGVPMQDTLPPESSIAPAVTLAPEKTCAEYRHETLRQMKGAWMPAVGVTLVYGILIVAFELVGNGLAYLFGKAGGEVLGTVAYLAAYWIVSLPLVYGLLVYFIRRAVGEPAALGNLFDGFRIFPKALGTGLLVYLFTGLWTLLFIVPGFVKGYGYSLSIYILRLHPEMPAMEILSKSSKMMYGHKMDMFLLVLSFIGWGFLATIPLGLGWLWLGPYMMQTLANFWKDVYEKESGKVLVQPAS
jgi:uncharacterized membrane protein